MSSDEYTEESSDDEKKEDLRPGEVDWRSMENIRVIARFRPTNSREKREEKTQDLVDSPPTIAQFTNVKLKRMLTQRGKPHDFNLDHIFHSNTSQGEVFRVVGRPMVEACIEGYNVEFHPFASSPFSN